MECHMAQTKVRRSPDDFLRKGNVFTNPWETASELGFFFFFFWAGGDNAQLGFYKISVLSSCQNPEYFIKLLMELTSLLQWKTLEAGILYSKMAIRCSVMSDSLWPIDRSPSGSSVHGILQAGILEGVAVPPLGVFLTLGWSPYLLYHLHCTCWAVLCRGHRKTEPLSLWRLDGRTWYCHQRGKSQNPDLWKQFNLNFEIWASTKKK